MSKIKVDKIVLKVGKKKEIELSLEEAKELQEVLADLLGMKDDNDNQITVIPLISAVGIPYPVPVPYPVPRRYERWEVTGAWTTDVQPTITICNTESSTGLLGSVNDGSTYVT